MLPRSVSGHLATRKFTFHSSSESFEEIFREVRSTLPIAYLPRFQGSPNVSQWLAQVVIRNDTGVHFGYKMVEWLLDNFYSMHLSIQSLQRELTVRTLRSPGLYLP